MEEIDDIPFLEMAKVVSVKQKQPTTNCPKKFTRREVAERAERCEIEEFGLKGLQRRMNGGKK